MPNPPFASLIRCGNFAASPRLHHSVVGPGVLPFV